MIAKYDIDPDDFYFARTLNAAAIAALAEDLIGKNRIEAEKKLKSSLYLCIGDEAQGITKARKPAVNVKTETQFAHGYWTKCKMSSKASEM